MDKPDGDATRAQAPAILDASTGATRSLVSQPGDALVDEPEHYLVESQIGAGGMGTVLAAKGARLGRMVAIKVVTSDREDLRRRFEREAQVTARLQHPSIVPVYGTGYRRDGLPFYAMKQVTGEPLDKVIAGTETLAARIAFLPNVIAVSDAIAYAHAERVIHRDLKPANILVGKFGETVVIDWGLAKDLATTDDAEVGLPHRPLTVDQTAYGKVMGTPAYMPLEQARGERVDERSDVYALGAILYHLLAGQPPYARPGERGAPWETMLARVISAPAPALREVVPEAPPDLLAIVDRAMARDPGDRYPTAGELAADLRRFQTGQLVGAHRYSSWELLKRWLRRHRTAVAVAAIAIVVIGVGSAVSIREIIDERDTADAQRVIAQRKTKEANTRRDASEKLVDFVVFELRKRLSAVGRTDILAGLGGTIVQYFDQVTDPDAPIDSHELGNREEAIDLLGDVELQKGDRDAAEKLYRGALDVIVRLAEHEPSNGEWQRSLSVAHGKMGDVFAAKRDWDKARGEYEVALGIIQRVSSTDPEQWDWMHEHAIAIAKMAYVNEGAGSWDAALTSWSATLALYRKLGDARVTERGPRVELAVCLSRMADNRVSAGKVSEAITFNDEASAILTGLLATSDDADVRRTLASVLMARAMIEQRLGRLDDARAAFVETIAAWRSLRARDPANELDADQLCEAGAGAVELENARHDPRAALVLADGASQECDVSSPAGRNSPTRMFATARLRSAAGDAALTLHDPKRAFADLRSTVELYNYLATKVMLVDPAPRRATATARLHLASALLAEHDAKAARGEALLALATRDELARTTPADLALQRDLANAREKLGDIDRALADAGAVTDYRAALAIRTAVLAHDPGVRTDQLAVARLQGRVAQSRPPVSVDEARALLRSAIGTFDTADAGSVKLDTKQRALLNEFTAELKRLDK